MGLHKILIIEDHAQVAETIRTCLESTDEFVCQISTHGRHGFEEAINSDFSMIISDINLPGLSGLEIVRKIHDSKPSLPVILMTGHSTTDTAIRATQQGAFDYLMKPFDMDTLLTVVRRAIQSQQCSMNQPASEEEHLPPISSSPNLLIGNSPAMRLVYKEIGRVTQKNVGVLILGETGTGKDLVAQAIHHYSDRSQNPFISINCTAIPETLLESELFGHERGAFTGADAQRIGRFEQAHQGTLFLDEIGDVPPNTQAKLLRVIQEKKIQRLGGRESIPVNVRVVAATHRDLESAIQTKQFREDLFYRLSVVIIRLPPLRERQEDVSQLALHFIRKYGIEMGSHNPSIHPEALGLLQDHSWPGNVRELENVVRRALLLSQGFMITPQIVEESLVSEGKLIQPSNNHLASWISHFLDQSTQNPSVHLHRDISEAFERELYHQVFKKTHGNQVRIATLLGVSRPTVHEKLTRYGIKP